MPEELRDWQKPLSEEKILELSILFAAHKAHIETFWGVRRKPWSNRVSEAWKGNGSDE
jgi:hypothetical protein